MTRDRRDGYCFHQMRVRLKSSRNESLVGLENYCYNCNGNYLIHNDGMNGNTKCHGEYHCEGHIDFLDVHLNRCFNHSKAKKAKRRKEELNSDQERCFRCSTSSNNGNLCQGYTPINVDVLDFNRILGVFKNSREYSQSEQNPNPFSV